MAPDNNKYKSEQANDDGVDQSQIAPVSAGKVPSYGEILDS